VHSRRITPAQILAGFSGDVTAAQARQLLEHVLATLPGDSSPDVGAIPIPAPRGPATQTARGLELWVVDKPDRSQVQLRVGQAALPGTHPDALALWLGTVAFGGMFTSPLVRAVRDERGWSYTAHAGFDRQSPFLSPLVLRSAPDAEHAIPCLELELDLYRELAQGSLDSETLDAVARIF